MRLNKTASAITGQNWRALVAAGALVSAGSAAFAEPITLGQVDISGYLDMSYNTTDPDDGDSVDKAGLDRAEVRFKSQLDEKVSIEAHVAGGADETYELEQANVNFQATDELSFIAGKYLSALGWEAFHAPDLYQWSTSVGLVYPAFFNGAGAKYKTDAFEVYGSVSSDIWDGTNTDADSLGYETAFRMTAIENFTLFAGYASSEVVDLMTLDTFDQAVGNIWASYKLGSLLLAVEYNDVANWGMDGNDGDSWLAMANYAFTDKFSLTLRTSGIQLEDDTDLDQNTIAGLYALTSNVTMVAEYSVITDNQTDVDTNQMALEMIVVF